MLIAVMVFVYLIGYMACYYWFRAIVREREHGDWDLFEKIIVMTLSLFSWAATLALIILLITGATFNIDFDKKCKW